MCIISPLLLLAPEVAQHASARNCNSTEWQFLSLPQPNPFCLPLSQPYTSTSTYYTYVHRNTFRQKHTIFLRVFPVIQPTAWATHSHDQRTQAHECIRTLVNASYVIIYNISCSIYETFKNFIGVVMRLYSHDYSNKIWNYKIFTIYFLQIRRVFK